MSVKDLHKAAFDEGTIAKLEIFEDYAEAWIPTFVMSNTPRLAIFDFFAGQGYDVDRVPGSAIRILNKIKDQVENIEERGTKIDLILNEFKRNKFELLVAACAEFLKNNPRVAAIVDVSYRNEDFQSLFPAILPKVGSVPSLVYLDQNGIKFTSSDYLLELEKKPQTDFLYFVSSSYLLRFGDREEFRKHLDFDLDEAKKNPYRFIHRHVVAQLRNLLPSNTRLILYPYSIKKGSNIYGIIFGATHPRAVDKFLKVAWNRNATNGEANFDIHEDASKAQPDLWGGKTLTKLEEFEQTVESKLLSGELASNEDLLKFAYSQGHLGSHAAAVIRQMKKDGKILYEGTSPLVTYEMVFKNRRILRYEVTDGANKH